MKVAVIGGGSSYTPELIAGFLARVPGLPLAELWLMDISAQRLEVVGGLARRMIASQGKPFALQLTTDRRLAVRGARYVIVQLRVGGLEARREDEYLGRRHGLIGQETTGVGGMAKALRTIPILLDIARDTGELAPGALLVNFANPAGLVTEALARHAPEIASVGVCNVALHTKMEMVDALNRQFDTQIEPQRARLDTLGLNHLTWHRGLEVDPEPGQDDAGSGPQDLWPQVMAAYLADLQRAPEPEWSPRTVEVLGMIPNYYLHYYYHTGRKLAEQEAWPPSRAEEVMAIEEDLLSLYAEPGRSQPPADLAKRGGAFYSTVASQLLNAHCNDLGESHVLNIPHRGAVDGWPGDWVLEMPCRVDAHGIHPLPAELLPPACFGLLAQVKMYEILAVEAAVHGSRDAAYQALLAHPLGPQADRLQAVLDDLLETNRPFLPRFWPGA